MTLNAQTFIAGAAQVVFVERAITRIVARDTGHRLTIAWIVCLITGRVAEIIVLFVTIGTGFISTTFKHSWLCGSMELVTIETAISVWVEMCAVFTSFKFTRMAITADFTGVATN